MVQTIQPQALAIIVTFPVISTIFVALRVAFRTWNRQFKWGMSPSEREMTRTLTSKSDDAFCVLAWALAVANAGITYRYAIARHTGYHIWDVPERSIEVQVYSAKLSMAQQLSYNPTLCLVKASVIVFLMRLGDQRRMIRYSLATFFIFNIGHMIAVFFGVLTQCLPIHMYWDHPKTDQIIDGKVVNPNYTCFNAEAFIMSTASIAILTDILILSIPIAMVWPLRLNWRKKIAVGCVLSLGWIVVIVALIRLKSFYNFFNVVNPDPTYALGVTVSVVEVNVAIILSCGPAINSIITRYAPKLFASRGASNRTFDTAGEPYEYEIPSRRPKRYDLPSLPSSRNSTRPYRERDDDDGDSQLEIMNNDSLGARRADVIRAMIDNDKNGRGMYAR
jgi:hypothetical protein